MIRLSKINELGEIVDLSNDELDTTPTTTYTITIPTPTDETASDGTPINVSLIGLITKVNDYYAISDTDYFTDDEKAIIMAILNNHVNEGCSVAGKAEELSVGDIV